MAAYRLMAQRGWGSSLVEAMLALCQAEMEIEDVSGFDKPGESRERLLAVNPLAQLPTLILPEGGVMTESVAIALLLAERFPQAGLAPPPGSAHRPEFLRRLVWLVANVYPNVSVADYPERWVTHDRAELKEAMFAAREVLWREFESRVTLGEWAIGPFSAIDIFVAVMTRWEPGQAWFAREAPALAAIATRIDAHPVLGPVMQRNFRRP